MQDPLLRRTARKQTTVHYDVIFIADIKYESQYI